MLARASKRRVQHDSCRQPFLGLDALQLPFLCPALYRPSNHPRNKLTTTIRHLRPSLKHLGPKLEQPAIIDLSPQHRNLASAAAVGYAPSQEEFIPFESFDPQAYTRPSAFGQPSFSVLPPFDPDTSPLIIKDNALTTNTTKFRSLNAVTGDLNEIHQTLHACLQVGRLERAAVLVRRLSQIYKPDAPGLLAAHNDYVREITLRIVRNKDQQLLKDLHKWFEVDLKGHGVTPDAATYALMVQATLQDQEPDPEKAKRTTERYLNLAREAGIGDETLTLLSRLEETAEFASGYAKSITESVLERIEDLEGQEVFTASAFTDSVPEVKRLQIKGLGLSTLKKSLSVFSDPVAAETSAVERQRFLERNTYEAAIERWRSEDVHLKTMGVNNALSGPRIGAIMYEWHVKMVPIIRNEVRMANEAETKDTRSRLDHDRAQWGPYLQWLSPEKLSAITILACTRILTTQADDQRGVRLHNVVTRIGNSVHDESIAQDIRKSGHYSQWRDLSQVETLKKLTNLIKRRHNGDSLAKLANRSGDTSQIYHNMDWNEATKVRVGAMLLSHLMDVARVEVSRQDPKTGKQLQEAQPVFFHTYQYIKGKRVGVVRFNSTIMRKLTKEPVNSAFAKYLPMVVEPRPWVGFREGGFLEHAVSVVRLNATDTQSKQYMMTAAKNGDMDRVFAGLDALSKTAWQINRGVFDVMLEAWNSGEAIAKIPPEDPPIDLPPEPLHSDDPRARYTWMKTVRELENHRSGLRSQRCFHNFQLEIARAYLNETFYFPHNVDFRGRAYPMAPFLNHMGADHARGLLKFAKGKELTAKGLWWLKIHLANVFGYDKANLEERQKFTQDHLSEIYDSATNPLNGNRWWLKGEDPWQCLAACKEVRNALESPDPSRYVSHLAIHQDGTCNGLQHYAALGGDEAGAKQVNLEPGERPSDIYTSIAELVKADIAEEAAQGFELAFHLDGKVTRKVVKQTVMTNVYGVTFRGAKLQVRKQLDIILTDFPNTRTVNKEFASRYIARKIFKALNVMFNGAHDIQYWLGACAGRISESLSPEQISQTEDYLSGKNPESHFNLLKLKGGPKSDDPTTFKSGVIWTTPLKMPVVQPYRKRCIHKVETNLQEVSVSYPSALNPINKAKQLQAFPPNFIHSLDGTHMFLTALKCDEMGLTFASVHDSFWTHAGDVDTMNKIIRDAFIRMHSEDIVGRLSAEFKARYKNYMHLASVDVKSAVGKRIAVWTRTNSGLGRKKIRATEKRTTELLLECRRLRLLASDNPAEREEGAKMVTPASLFAEAAEQDKKVAPLEYQPAVIGEVSLRSAKLKANQKLKVGDVENAKMFEPTLGVDAIEDDLEAEDEDNVESGVLPTNALDPANPEDADTDAEERATPEVKEKVKYKRKTRLWLPLTFPPVPAKGGFDVRRLRDSQYFFS